MTDKRQKLIDEYRAVRWDIDPETAEKCANIAEKYCAEQLRINGVVATLPKDPIVLARYLHEAYEMIAKNQKWNTQENCKVDFSDLPIENKNTMILLAGKILQDFGGN